MFYIWIAIALLVTQWLVSAAVVRFGIREYFRQKRRYLLDMMQYDTQAQTQKEK